MNPYIQYMYSYPHKTAYRPLAGIRLADCADSLSGPGCGLYLHIPFCQTKCGYCNLFSVTGAGAEEMERYLDAVERQLNQYRRILEPAGTRFSDFTIGGGTPLLLTARQLERVLSMTESDLHFDKNRSIVIETAPNQTDREKLQLLKGRGITRVSMGIQSFCDRELETLRRGHSGKKALEALELLLSFGFDCVNADFIYGIPGQTVESLLESLERAVSLGPQEIFLYPLYVKHGAGLERELRNGMVLEPEKAFEQYREASSFLKSEGFRQDSMRRFVRRKSEVSQQGSTAQEQMIRRKSEHLRPFSECGFGTSLALGCGGRSYVGNLHFCTPYAITRQDCLRELYAYENTQDFTAVTHGIVLSREEQKRRYAIRHLLIRPGLDIGRYREHFGTEILEDFPLLSEWIGEGYLVQLRKAKSDWLVLTDDGLGLSDYLGPQLISKEIGAKMAEWEAAHGQTNQPLMQQLQKL